MVKVSAIQFAQGVFVCLLFENLLRYIRTSLCTDIVHEKDAS